tara:strand:+ start:219 stop:512 length:294 start_codon:yes stop_codon:yes gene_type:complete
MRYQKGAKQETEGERKERLIKAMFNPIIRTAHDLKAEIHFETLQNSRPSLLLFTGSTNSTRCNLLTLLVVSIESRLAAMPRDSIARTLTKEGSFKPR